MLTDTIMFVIFSLAALLSRVFLGERVVQRTLVAIAVCMLGMSLVFMGEGAMGMLTGNLYALAAAAVIGGNLTLLRRYSAIDPMTVIAGGGLLSAVVALPMASLLINSATRYLSSTEVGLF